VDAPRDRLLERLSAIQARLRGWERPEIAAADFRSDREGGTEGDIAALVDRDLAFADRERLIASQAQLEAALARIDDGTWGECATCGLPIGDKRLAAIPEAEQCIACASEREDRQRRARGILDEEPEEQC
jgi:DnaK suppressor protein